MTTPPKPLLICLMGPTASGKTDLAIELAGQRDCELVSVDSALVYRGLDIGSAKPDYPHHLIDIRDPSDVYSVAEFVADARRLAADITTRGKTPLLVGGTMLYFKSFLEGLDEMPAADTAIRAEIEAQAAAHGWPYIHAQLAAVDPESAARIHPNHSQRLGRALEVFRASGITMTEWHSRQKRGSGLALKHFTKPGGASLDLKRFKARPDPLDGPLYRYRIVQLAICPADRAVLHQRIARRFEQIMAAGFLEEVRQLRRRDDLHLDLPAIRAVGYRQLWQHLAGECSLEEAVTKAVAATRQLAKRQLTWLRKWPDLRWIYTDTAGNLSQQGLSDELMGYVGQKPVNLALNYLDRPPL
ncbi:MAG: tRNA (adenosine(37)-N6)-dimethylallyltransferase MiaA [Gammaproteobacteria bacterium]|nr:MAG: tRNA (adenosine(37)-N6)-dimethylallyltransferase MiaA [Gammaproteobacteria bacterium]